MARSSPSWSSAPRWAGRGRPSPRARARLRGRRQPGRSSSGGRGVADEEATPGSPTGRPGRGSPSNHGQRTPPGRGRGGDGGRALAKSARRPPGLRFEVIDPGQVPVPVPRADLPPPHGHPGRVPVWGLGPGGRRKTRGWSTWKISPLWGSWPWGPCPALPGGRGKVSAEKGGTDTSSTAPCIVVGHERAELAARAPRVPYFACASGRPGGMGRGRRVCRGLVVTAGMALSTSRLYRSEATILYDERRQRLVELAAEHDLPDSRGRPLRPRPLRRRAAALDPRARGRRDGHVHLVVLEDGRSGPADRVLRRAAGARRSLRRSRRLDVHLAEPPPAGDRARAHASRRASSRTSIACVGCSRRRKDAMLAALASEMPAGTTWSSPEGGYFLWLDLPGGTSTRQRC